MCTLEAIKYVIWGSKPRTYFVFFKYICIFNMNNRNYFFNCPPNCPKYVPSPGYKFICLEGGKQSNTVYYIIYLFMILTIYFPSISPYYHVSLIRTGILSVLSTDTFLVFQIRPGTQKVLNPYLLKNGSQRILMIYSLL